MALLPSLPARFCATRFIPVVVVCLFFLAAVHYLDFSVVPSSLTSQKDNPDHHQQGLPEKQKPEEANGEKEAEKPQSKPEGGCLPELQFLQSPELGLSKKFEYTRRCVKPVFSADIDRDVVSNLSQPLFTQSLSVDLESCQSIEQIPCEPLELTVPNPYPKNSYKNFVFAVATSYERLGVSKSTFAHWMANTDALLIGLITDEEKPDSPKLDFPALEEDFKKSGVNLKLVKPHSPKHSWKHSHLMVILDMIEAATNDTQWLGILDDDTFVPHMLPLAETLKAYDHTKPAYIGALSESFQACRFGMAAFGGAGIFISVPLAKELEPHLESCLSARGGDMQLMECIYKHSHAKLQTVPALHQQDMQGDLSGFFESGWRYLSLHHWKSWYKAPVEQMAKIVNICGECFLQRWVFGEDTVLSNGYSIAKYPKGLPDLNKMEATWNNADSGDFDWSMGPLRAKVQKGDKKLYRLVDAVPTESGGLRQIFVFKGDKEKNENDEVIELVWDGSSSSS